MTQYLYSNGKYLSTQLDNVSTMTQAFNYGTAAFEGMKAFYHPEKKRSFVYRPDQYFQRLQRSTQMLEIDLKITLDQFIGILTTLFRKNKIDQDTYIRPIVYRSQKGVGLAKASDYGISIFIQPTPYSAANQFRCCFVSQRRPTDGTYSVKLTGNYLLSFFALQEAKRRGFDVGILMSTAGHVSEAAVMNLFFVDNGKLFTPSLECGALAGITRKSLIELAKRELGLKVSEGKFQPQRLLDADEVFFTGTGSGVNYVAQIEKRKFNLKRQPQVAQELSEVYADVTRGKLPRYADWLVPLK